MADENGNSFTVHSPTALDPGNAQEYQSIIQKTNNDDILKRVKRANGIYEPKDFNDWGTFYRYQRMDPYRIAPNTREYIFITKPDLNIFQNGAYGQFTPGLQRNTVFRDLYERGYNDVLTNLQWSVDSSCPFIRAFTNLKRSSVDLNDIQASDQETASNLFGTKLYYRTSSFGSDEDSDFNIEFEDSKYLDVYMWFRAYDEYERKKFEGAVTPEEQYVTNRVLHDQMTLFKFIVDDTDTIIHYSRIVGIYPKNVARSTFSDLPQDGRIKISTSWHGTFVKDQDPEIIAHFNWLCSFMSGTTVDPWDPTIQAIDGDNVTSPIIGTQWLNSTRRMVYKLNWRR